MVIERFAAAVRALEERGLLDASTPRGRQALVCSTSQNAGTAWDDVSRRYFAAGIACPFLEDECCSIYDDRPMTCREYGVTTPPERCADLDGGARAVDRPVRMSEVLGRVAALELDLPTGTLPLTLALEWHEVHGGALEALREGEALFWALMEQVDEESSKPFDRRAAPGAPGRR